MEIHGNNLHWQVMRVYAVFLFVFLVSGCTKKSNVYMFDCTVYDQKVDAGVEGALVVMKVQDASGGGFNPTYITVGSATTDASGRFYIEVPKAVYYSFRAVVTHPNHFSQNFNINPDDVPFSTAYSSTFNIEPKAWVSTHLLNQNASQTATFAVNADTDECTDCCPSSNTILQGTSADTTFICEVYGEQQISVNGTYVDENGAVHQIAETAYVNAFDTITVNITY